VANLNNYNFSFFKNFINTTVNPPTNLLTAPQTRSLGGKINLPTSKSISNRLLILQALSGHAFAIDDLSEADDTQILAHLLTQIEQTDTFYCGHGGTTLRFLTAYLAVRTKKTVTITGSERLCERPVHILVQALRSLGADIRYLGKEGFPPLSIAPAVLNKTHKISVDGSVSSQFISALLLIAPALPQGLQVSVKQQNSVSSTYLDTTIQTLQIADYQAIVQIKGDTTVFNISPEKWNRPFPKTLRVPPDWSSATYFFALSALCTGYNSIIIPQLESSKPPQADEAIIAHTEGFVRTIFNKGFGTVLYRTFKAKLIKKEIDCTDCPDLVPTLAVIYAGKRRKILFTGLQTLRIKETDRIAALQTELAKIGVQTHATADTLAITGFTMNFKTDFKDKTVSFATYNDHRMAMALAPLALVLPSIIIENPGVVSKSFPHYWQALQILGFTGSETLVSD
jgi:3-phosphoshikimate 1-carboxyvinyltransferase